MIGRLARLLALLATVTLLSGCWDYFDLERRAPVMGIGIDRAEGPDGGFVVTAEIPRATLASQTSLTGGPRGGQREPYILVTARGATIGEALHNLNATIARRALWEQVISVVISEDVLQEGISPLLDLFNRNATFNSRARIYAAAGTARDVFTFQPDFQPFVAVFLDEMGEEFALEPHFAGPPDVHTVEHELEESAAVLLPVVRKNGTDLQLDGSVALTRGVLVARLDGRITEGAQWLLGRVKQSVTLIPCPREPSVRLAVTLRTTKRTVRVSLENGLPHFRVELAADMRVEEFSRCPLNLRDPGDRKALEDQAARALARLGQEAADYAREVGVDFLRFGTLVERKFPAVWEEINWRDTFPRSTITVRATTLLKTAGELRRPPTLH